MRVKLTYELSTLQNLLLNQLHGGVYSQNSLQGLWVGRERSHAALEICPTEPRFDV